jgi:hypothetical protein
MRINITGATIEECNTDVAEWIIDFYSREVERHQIKNWIRMNGYSIVEKEIHENGEFVSLYVE